MAKSSVNKKGNVCSCARQIGMRSENTVCPISGIYDILELKSWSNKLGYTLQGGHSILTGPEIV